MRQQSVAFGLQSVTFGMKETRMRQQSVACGLQALDLKMKAIARFRAAQFRHGVLPGRMAQSRRGLAEQFAGQVKIGREHFAQIGGGESPIEFVPVDCLLMACPQQRQIHHMAKLNLVQGV